MECYYFRNLKDWEVEGIVSFFNLLLSHVPSREGGDGLWWRLKGNEAFDIRSFYSALRALLRRVFLGEASRVSKPPSRFLSLFGLRLGEEF